MTTMIMKTKYLVKFNAKSNVGKNFFRTLNLAKVQILALPPPFSPLPEKSPKNLSLRHLLHPFGERETHVCVYITAGASVLTWTKSRYRGQGHPHKHAEKRGETRGCGGVGEAAVIVISDL